MSMSKKAKTVLLACCAVLLLAAGVFAAVHIVRIHRKTPTEGKIISGGCSLRVRYEIDSATEYATIIVYGTLGPKDEAYEQLISYDLVRDDRIIGHYKRADIQVIQMIKGDLDAQTVPYWELVEEYEADDVIYRYSDARPRESGKNYIFFLSEIHTPLEMMEVDENGILTPYWDMRIQNEAQALSEDPLPVSIEDYIAEIQKYLNEPEGSQ